MADKSLNRPEEPSTDSSTIHDQPPINGVAITTPLPQRKGSSKRHARSDLPDHPSALPPAPEVPHAAPVSYRNSYSAAKSRHSDESRSFSARAKDLPAGRGLDKLDQYVASESTQWTDSEHLANNTRSTRKTHTRTESQSSVPQLSLADPRSSRRVADATESDAPVSPASHSSTLRTPPREDRQRREWAPDRSPLQKLEVTLKDISKEEKRARVEEAEMLLRESKAGRRSRRVSRDVTSTSRDPSRRESDTGVPSNLEEAGLVRSLSSKQRDRLQYSAILESTKPDPRQFSTEGRMAFDYEEQQSMNNKSLGKMKVPGASGRAQSLSQQPVALASDHAVGQSTSQGVSGAARPQGRHQLFNTHAIGDVEQQVDSSRRASLPAAASIRPPFGVQQGENRKLQKPLPRDPNTRLLVEHRDSQRVTKNPSHHVRSLSVNDARLPTSQMSGLNQNAPDVLSVPRKATVGLGLTNAFGDQRQPAVPTAEESPLAENVQSKPKHSVSFDVPPPTPPPLTEWKDAKIARLRAADFDLRETDTNKAWWEGGGSGKRRASKGITRDDDQPQIMPKRNTPFNPPLFLKCGPLLRYTGLKRERIDGATGPIEREIWRGSIMIVTEDSASSYNTPPTLRIFSQPMDLLPPPPAEIGAEDGEQLAPEYVDPIAGFTKLGRDGKLLYVKPVDHLEEGKDLSLIEDDDGIFEESPSPLDYTPSVHAAPSPSARVQEKDGEVARKFKQIEGVRMYADPTRHVTFWRFSLEIELIETQQRVAYRINQGSPVGFWVPARGKSMNIMFYSGNGFGMSVDSNKFSGPDPLWRDVLNTHQTRPFHVMIGGGEQINNDKIVAQTKFYQQWMNMKITYEKHQYPFTLDLKAELETFYLDRYSAWFSQGLFGMANSQIPMVNIWNDHDIIGGVGSYPDQFMKTPVFTGLGAIAFKYYMLFQHQSVPDETEADEPSWLLGATPGPYIHQKSRSVFMNLGKSVAFLGLDCRTERTRDVVLRDDSYELIWDRCHEEIVKGETKHLLVLLGVPITYPRLVWLENVLTSRVMDPLKSLGKAGLFGSLGNKFDLSIEDVDDQWTASSHKVERSWLIEDLQELAAQKSVRVTILGGDGRLAAIGQFYSNPKLNVAKDKDYRYMPNVISSGIVNAPVSEMMGDALNRRNKIHFMDASTLEDMRPIFTHDVDGNPRNNKRLLPRRNWCSIREYVPGSTPTHTPEPPTPNAPDYPPGKLMRSLSLSRGDRTPGKFLRRLSLRGPPPSRSFGIERPEWRRMSYDGPPPSGIQDSHAPRQPQLSSEGKHSPPLGEPPSAVPGAFIRRRTDLSVREIKARAKSGSSPHEFINLEGGLDITLNCEVSAKDPAGITTPYRLLVPALWFEGDFEPSAAHVKNRWMKWMTKREKTDQAEPQVQYLEGLEDNSDANGEEEDAQNEDEAPPVALTPPQDGYSTTLASVTKRAQGYSGVDAYRPRKKWLGLI